MLLLTTHYEDFIKTLKGRKYDPTNEPVGISSDIERSVLNDADKHRWNYKLRNKKLVW